jgi:hypothetical protein
MRIRAQVRICDEIISVKSDACTYMIDAMYKEYAMDVHRALDTSYPPGSSRSTGSDVYIAVKDY